MQRADELQRNHDEKCARLEDELKSKMAEIVQVQPKCPPGPIPEDAPSDNPEAAGSAPLSPMSPTSETQKGSTPPCGSSPAVADAGQPRVSSRDAKDGSKELALACGANTEMRYDQPNTESSSKDNSASDTREPETSGDNEIIVTKM